MIPAIAITISMIAIAIFCGAGKHAFAGNAWNIPPGLFPDFPRKGFPRNVPGISAGHKTEKVRRFPSGLSVLKIADYVNKNMKNFPQIFTTIPGRPSTSYAIPLILHPFFSNAARLPMTAVLVLV